MTKRQYDLDRHQKTHFPSSRPGRKFDCTGRGCRRTGENGFARKDHLREHLRKVHAKDIPEQNRQIRRGLELLGSFESYNADSKAPSELKAQVGNNNDVPPPPPMPPMVPVKYSSRILKPVGSPKSTSVELPKTTTLLDNPSNLERLRSLSFQILYGAEKIPGTASDIKKSISHDVVGDDKEPPSSTSLESVSNVQVARETEILHGKYKSQSVKLDDGPKGLNPNKIERRPSTGSADVKRSTMTITGKRGVQDTVEPEKIVSEPDNEARASKLDNTVHTMPLTLIDANDGLMSSLFDYGYEPLQDDDDVSSVDGPLCFYLACTV